MLYNCSSLTELKLPKDITAISSNMCNGCRSLKTIEIPAGVTTIDNDAFKGVEAIIMSMTPYERDHPEVINGSRRKRIADGSGTSLPEVNRLLKQFEGTRKVMKTAMTGNLMQKMKGFRR